ncbi:MAG: hypothetical protein AAF351_08490 [Pseudomonadota bacterium]
MTQEKLRMWFEVIGITAVVASLIFVGVQLRQEQEIASGQYAYDWLNAKIELSNLVAENKDIWVAGLKGEELSEVDSAVLDAMISAWVGFQTARYRNRLLISGGSEAEVALEVANSMHTFPRLKTFWRGYVAYAVDLHGDAGWTMASHVNRILDELESGTRKHVPNYGFHVF